MKIEGVNMFIANLEAYSLEVSEGAKNAVQNTASDIEIGAIRDAPQFIKSMIDKRVTDQGYTAYIGVQGSDPIPVYWEFGTGQSAKLVLANYPQEVKDLAWKYKRPQDGTLKGQPYLFPNLFKNQKTFLDRLKALIK